MGYQLQSSILLASELTALRRWDVSEERDDCVSQNNPEGYMLNPQWCYRKVRRTEKRNKDF